MRTKKVEIATEQTTPPVSEKPTKAAVKPGFSVSVTFQSRENAENFKFKLKSLGYDNAEIVEVMGV